MSNQTGFTGLDSDQDHALTERVIGLAMKVHRGLGTKADEVQLVNDLTATNRDFGPLFNFGTQSLQFKWKHRRPAADATEIDLHNPVNPVNPV